MMASPSRWLAQIAGLVSIDPSSGEVTLDSSANYEIKDSYSFDVIATDNGTLTDTQGVTVSVTDVNEAPSISTGASGMLLRTLQHRRLFMMRRQVMLMLVMASPSRWRVQIAALSA